MSVLAALVVARTPCCAAGRGACPPGLLEGLQHPAAAGVPYPRGGEGSPRGGGPCRPGAAPAAAKRRAGECMGDVPCGCSAVPRVVGMQALLEQATTQRALSVGSALVRHRRLNCPRVSLGSNAESRDHVGVLGVCAMAYALCNRKGLAGRSSRYICRTTAALLFYTISLGARPWRVRLLTAPCCSLPPMHHSGPAGGSCSRGRLPCAEHLCAGSLRRRPPGLRQRPGRTG